MPDKRMPARPATCRDCGAVKVSGLCPDCAGLLTLPVRDPRGRLIPGMTAFIGSPRPTRSTGSEDSQ